MGLRTKRAYEPAEPADGYRVLIDRLWPRGVTKEAAHLDEWARDLGPSTELRRWFGHDPERWDEFRTRYRQELAEPAKARMLDDLAERAREGRVTVVYGARDEEHNQAVVLKEMLEELRGK